MSKHALLINCVDGRTQTPVIGWMKENVPADIVHNVTEPGPDLAIYSNRGTSRIKDIVQILSEKNELDAVAVIGHHDCLGNSVNKDKHIKHIKTAVDKIVKWKLSPRVIGLWVDDQWTVNKIVDKA